MACDVPCSQTPRNEPGMTTNHREEILRGARGGKLDEDGLYVFQYFTSSCYSGLGDDDKGFYAVYRDRCSTP